MSFVCDSYWSRDYHNDTEIWVLLSKTRVVSRWVHRRAMVKKVEGFEWKYFRSSCFHLSTIYLPSWDLWCGVIREGKGGPLWLRIIFNCFNFYSIDIDRYRLGAIAFLPMFRTPIVILSPLSFTLYFYPYYLEMEPHFIPTPWTTHNRVEEDNFALANISFLSLWIYLCLPLHSLAFNKNMNKNLIEFGQHFNIPLLVWSLSLPSVLEL